ADGLVDLALELLVFGVVEARGDEDLEEHDLARTPRVAREEGLEGAQLERDALGVVEALDGEDDLAPAVALAEVGDVARGLVARERGLEAIDRDADGVH